MYDNKSLDEAVLAEIQKGPVRNMDLAGRVKKNNALIPVSTKKVDGALQRLRKKGLALPIREAGVAKWAVPSAHVVCPTCHGTGKVTVEAGK